MIMDIDKKLKIIEGDLKCNNDYIFKTQIKLPTNDGINYCRLEFEKKNE